MQILHELYFQKASHVKFSLCHVRVLEKKIIQLGQRRVLCEQRVNSSRD